LADKKYTIKDWTGTYHITEHDDGRSGSRPKEKTWAELLEEAKKLSAKPNPPVPKPLTKREQELEQSKKYYDKHYRGKIPNTIFDEIERALDY
jgi:hypothetical protein